VTYWKGDEKEMPPPKERENVLNLDSIEPGISPPINFRPQFLKDTPFGIKEKERQRRITNLHYVIHALAFIIIIPFLFMAFLGKNIPVEYSTIVSIVIGFYFGKAILEQN